MNKDPALVDHSDSWAGIMALHGFCILQLLSNSRTLLMHWLGPGMNEVGTVAQLGSIVLVLAAALLLGRVGAYLLLGGRLWVAVSLFTIVSLFIYGWVIHSYSIKEVVRDFGAFALAIAFLLLGSSPAFWRQALGWFFLYFLVAVLVNFAAMRDFGDLVIRAGEEARVARESISYRVQNALDFWPLLLLLAPFARRWQVTLLAAGMVFVLGQQILFQKRLETVFILGLLLLYAVMQHWRLRSSMATTASFGLLRAITGFSVAGIILASLWMPSVLQSQAAALLRRFEGRAPNQQVDYSHGFWSVFTLENERIQIAMICFQGFSRSEWLVGRGMGGAFPYESFDPKLLQTSHRSEIIDRAYLDDLDYFGRRSFETGFFMPLLKGGILLTSVFYSIYLLPLARLRELLGDPFSRGCLALAYFWLVYTLMGGNFSAGLSFQMLGLYAPLGWCLTRREEDILPCYAI